MNGASDECLLEDSRPPARQMRPSVSPILATCCRLRASGKFNEERKPEGGDVGRKRRKKDREGERRRRDAERNSTNRRWSGVTSVPSRQAWPAWLISLTS